MTKFPKEVDVEASTPFVEKSSSTEEAQSSGNKGGDYNQGVLSICMYVICSVGMVLANKAISGYMDPEVKMRIPQISIINFQCFVAVMLVEFAKWRKWVEYDDFDAKTAKAWLPLNILFIGMLLTGFLSLVHNNVPMVTVFKNLTNVLTVGGDALFYGENVTKVTALSLFVMVMGAVLSSTADLEFSFLGYMWMSLNCLFTSGYVLYMRYVSTSMNLSRFGMVYYNNVISMALLTPLAIMMNEIPALMDPEIMTPNFMISNVLAGFLGFYLNFASLWCVGATSATTYAIVGSVSKVPTTILGAIIFETVMTNEGVMYVTMATIGGGLYAMGKILEKKNKSREK